METFPAQPDEGYSEDPLNPASSAHQQASLEEMPDWLLAQLPRLPLPLKKKLAAAILDALPTSAIAEIVEALNPRLYIDFVRYLPPEVCLKILEHLDPSSLISVASSCKAWHTLALDKNLWLRLYHLEGWSVVPAEIQRWQERVNNIYQLGLERTSAEDRSYSRKRPISDGSDMDCEMMDADRPYKQQEQNFLGGAPFKSPGWSAPPVDPDRPSPVSDDVAMGDSKGKGPDLGPEASQAQPRINPASESLAEDPKVFAALESLPGPETDALSPSTLWNWDPRHEKYVVNWKYLYSMRRRLESNWELGRFTNFQFPHPNYPEEGHSECVYSLQFTPDFLVSGSRDRSIRIWSMRTRRLLLPPLRAHNGSVLCLQFDPDPEEDLIVSGSSDSDVILWRFSTGRLMQRLNSAHHESVLNVRFDKRILVTCSKDRTIKIFNRRRLRYGDVGYPDNEPVQPVPMQLKGYGYEPDLAHELPSIEPYTMIGALYGHNAAVNAVQICGTEIVSASGDKAIKVWDWPKQKCSRTILGHVKGIACIQYDGRRIVSGSSDNEVKVFDSSTGLEVASLRAHTNLVRTVQAGFGDLPNSVEADRMAARQVDEEYFRALETGAVTDTSFTEHNSRTGRRRGNAGSRRPQDITAYGANLPPGGGGGRYARIVSGSYDQSIIIWRRDKDGLWKDIHHLQQETAAASAQRAQRRLDFSLPRDPRRASTRTADGTPTPRHRPLTTEAAQAIINTVVARGAVALEQALAMYPAVLVHLSHLQAAIDRVSSPYVRNQLRQTVYAALERVNLQMGVVAHPQGSTSFVGPHTAGHPPPAPAHLANGPPIPPSQAQAQASQGQTAAAGGVCGQSPQDVSGPSPNAQSQPQNIPSNPQNAQTQPQTMPGNPQAVPADFMDAAAAVQPALGEPQIAPPTSQPPSAAAVSLGPAVAAVAAAAVAAEPNHHAHMTENSPARVFKLQFDARRIICCCQTHVIVGWDFCQGDVELEAVSRFFTTIT